MSLNAPMVQKRLRCAKKPTARPTAKEISKERMHGAGALEAVEKHPAFGLPRDLGIDEHQDQKAQHDQEA